MVRALIRYSRDVYGAVLHIDFAPTKPNSHRPNLQKPHEIIEYLVTHPQISSLYLRIDTHLHCSRKNLGVQTPHCPHRVIFAYSKVSPRLRSLGHTLGPQR